MLAAVCTPWVRQLTGPDAGAARRDDALTGHKRARVWRSGEGWFWEASGKDGVARSGRVTVNGITDMGLLREQAKEAADRALRAIGFRVVRTPGHHVTNDEP